MSIKKQRIFWILAIGVLFLFKLEIDGRVLISSFFPMNVSQGPLTLEGTKQIIKQKYDVEHLIDVNFDKDDSEWEVELIDKKGQNIEVTIDAYTKQIINVDYDD